MLSNLVTGDVNGRRNFESGTSTRFTMYSRVLGFWCILGVVGNKLPRNMMMYEKCAYMLVGMSISKGMRK